MWTHCQRDLNMNQNERGPTARPGSIQALIPFMVIENIEIYSSQRLIVSSGSGYLKVMMQK